MQLLWRNKKQRKNQLALILLLLGGMTDLHAVEPEFWYRGSSGEEPDQPGVYRVEKGTIEEVYDQKKHRLNAIDNECLALLAATVNARFSCNVREFLGFEPDIDEGFINGHPRKYNINISRTKVTKDEVVFTGESAIGVNLHRSCDDGLDEYVISVDGDFVYGCFSMLCPSAYEYSASADLCEAHCQTGQAWNAEKQTCINPPKEQDCKSQGPNPIDFIEGKKFRTEPVITTGVNSNISLTYFYNNQKNREKTASSSVPSAASLGSSGFSASNTYVAATTAPITVSEYQVTINNYGLPNNSPDVLPNQHYGAFDQYWRHNFDELLQIRGNEYVLHTAKGQSVRFAGLGYNAIYPHLNLQLLNAGEEPFTGFKITNVKTNTVKKFDSTGRLLKIVRAANDVLTLTYDTNNRVDRITNNSGAYLQLAYEEKPTKSIYSLTASNQSYPTSITSNTGEVVQLEWTHAYEGQTATFHMLTQKTNPSSSTATTSRVYEYNDPRWPASVTDIYDVSNIQNNTRTLYAHFVYDDKGRAVQSELANGYERVQVNYVDDNQRIVTNALGKNATYNFTDFNGVTRLHSVIGEATSSCAESNTTYSYYPNGNLQTKTKNGTVTHFEYNSRNLKTLETKAQGTLVEQVKKTCWPPTLNKPERIIEPSRVSIFEYFTNGEVKSKRTEQRTTANAECP